MKNPFVKQNDLNVTISPLVKTEKTASISWSHTTNTDLVKPNETQPIQRKIKKEQEVKKEGDGKREKKEEERTITALENLKGMLRIVASLIKNGQRKILALSQSKKTPMLFFGQFAHRKLVVHIKLFVMLSYTVKPFFTLSLELK